MALDGIKDGKYSLAEDGGGRVGNDARWRDSGEESCYRQSEWRWEMSMPTLTSSSQLAARPCTIIGEVQHRGLPGQNRLMDVGKRCKPATSA